MAAALKSCNFTKVVLKPIPVLENDFDTAENAAIGIGEFATL